VRLWYEPPDGGWRGEVESIQSGELVPIESLEQIVALILQAAGITQMPAASEHESKQPNTAREGETDEHAYHRTT
jgi:hypothetical protein